MAHLITCDVPGCGRTITGHNMARKTTELQIAGVGRTILQLNFPGRGVPHVCNQCVLEAIGNLAEPAVANVIPMPVKGGR